MEYLIMAYGRDFEPMAEIFCDSYMILEFYAMSHAGQICSPGLLIFGGTDFWGATIRVNHKQIFKIFGQIFS